MDHFNLSSQHTQHALTTSSTPAASQDSISSQPHGMGAGMHAKKAKATVEQYSRGADK